MISESQREQLIQKAVAVRDLAYSPYSKFKVGAAILTTDDEIYVGVNFENASYGLTICAERNAIGTLVTAGQRSIKAVAVSSENGVTPCGACRQVLVEFAPENVPVYLINTTTDAVTETTLHHLIPDAFDQSQLPSANGQI